MDAIRAVLAGDPRVAYALVFGSNARATAHVHSDIDIAIVFEALADRNVIEHDLAQRLRAASGLRNLIANQYGAVDFNRIFELASHDIEDLLIFCRQVARRSRG